MMSLDRQGNNNTHLLGADQAVERLSHITSMYSIVIWVASPIPLFSQGCSGQTHIQTYTQYDFKTNQEISSLYYCQVPVSP